MRHLQKMVFRLLCCIPRESYWERKKAHNSKSTPLSQNKTSIINYCLSRSILRYGSDCEFFNTKTLLSSWCIRPGCQKKFGPWGKIVQGWPKVKNEIFWHTLNRIHSESTVQLYLCWVKHCLTHTHTYMPGHILRLTHTSFPLYLST